MGDDLERLLHAAKPQPSPRFVSDLEDRLIGRPARRPHRRLVAGVAFAAGLAAVLVVLAVTGLLPLGVGGDEPVRAEDGCTTVLVERTERRPVFVDDGDGELRLSYRTVRVERPVTRCR